MFGVAKNANLIGVKVLDKEGTGANSRLIAGINWGNSFFSAPHPPHVCIEVSKPEISDKIQSPTTRPPPVSPGKQSLTCPWAVANPLL